MKPEILIAPTKEEWADLATRRVLETLQVCLSKRGEASLVLSGGSTPKAVLKQIAIQPTRITWDKVYVFWSDERCVPPDHPESNYGMAKSYLLDLVPIPAQNIFRMIGEIEPEAAAADYEETISAHFYKREKRFDLMLLGLGDDGHTASLFPDTPALVVKDKWVAANPHPYSDTSRLTLTFPALNASRQIFFLVTGENKAQVVKEVIRETHLPPPHPAKLVTGSVSSPVWILDSEAASKL